MGKLPFADLIRRINGINTPIGGVSWTPPEDERKAIRSFIRFLEDRRVLFDPMNVEIVDYAIQSVMLIREEVTGVLRSLGDESPALSPLQTMRAGCHKFLTDAGDQRVRHFHYDSPQFFVALGELRSVFGLRLVRLCAAYKLGLDTGLLAILPFADEDE